MRTAVDFRSMARDALNGKWKIAILIGVLATISGGTEYVRPEAKLNIDASGVDASLELVGKTLFSMKSGLNSDVGAFFYGRNTYIMIIFLIFAVLYFLMGSIIEIGYAKFNLNLVDRKKYLLKNCFRIYLIGKQQ